MIDYLIKGYNKDLLVLEYTTYLRVYSLINLINVYSASVMIFAILYLRKKVKSLKTKVVSSRERLMVVHASLFIVCISLSICSVIFMEIYVSSRQDYIMDAYQQIIPVQQPVAGEAKF